MRELLVSRRVGYRKIDGGDQLAIVECGGEDIEKEVVAGDLAPVGLHRGAEAEHGGGIIGGRVVVGDGAAQRAAVAHVRIANLAGELGKCRDRLFDGVRAGDGGMRGHRLDGDDASGGGDALQLGDGAQVDDIGRHGEALAQHRDQGLAAGHELAVVSGLAGLERVAGGGGAVVCEIVHGVSSAWPWRRRAPP